MTNSPAPDPARDHRPSPSVPGTLDGSMLAPGDLAAAEVAALCWLDPDFDPWSNDPERPASGDAPLEEHRYEAIIVDPYSSPPEGWETLSVAERRDLLGDDNCPVDPTDDPDQDVVPESLEAGFLHQYPTPGATGFRAGGPLDLMLPGNELAWHLGAARQTGLDQLSDDELIGVLAAARRIQSWQTELELAATAELDARRAGPDGREGEHVADELAAALTLTGRAAQAQLELSRQLERLPHTAGLLAAGIIDRPRAVVIASHLALLNDADAAAVDALVAAKAGAMTTGQLSARCHRAVVGYDPLAYLRRKKQAEKNARVECWTEHTGTAAIAGRDLDRALAIAADKSLDEAARWLQHQGVEGTLDELRTAVFLARLCQRPVETILPPAPDADPTPASATTDDPGTPPASATTDDPGTPPGSTRTPPAASVTPGPVTPGPVTPGPVTPGPGALTGVHLIMPATSWLGLSERPGEITGTGAAGPADAPTCRQLADTIARNPAARWCITLTDPAGRPVAHGCARAGPGPPGRDKHAWFATITITPIETGSCAHRHQSAGYQPSATLRHLIKIRSPRCGFPGCRRAAIRCDDDHTIPYHKGGRTCECNLHPLCRHHHQTKQAEGWHLAQPEPGRLIWTAPSGRTYAVGPSRYPV
jgi:hypothetical protein